MACDYSVIKAENERRYGTEIGRIGRMLLADRYADRTHFIFELLQNAEDALARRKDWNGSRGVEFALSNTSLRVSHFGTPFTEADVRGICGIAEGTKDKDLTSIGRFGIGFKSVYAFSDNPEVHSGDEHFAIDRFVWPRTVQAIGSEREQTVFLLPLRQDDECAVADIAVGLKSLGPRTLLFLREIEEISWSVEGGASGLYLRSKREPMGKNADKVTVIGEKHEAEPVEETWLVFSREVRTNDGEKAGYVEVAFSLSEEDDGKAPSVQPIVDSPLIVGFPTIVSTNLGFLMQGPYRTTPSRDNVSGSDPWNQHLIEETASLLVEALRGLRDVNLLDASALLGLPLNREKFGQGSMFSPLFEAVREALSSEPLLPRFGGGHISATDARLARTQDLRGLFSPVQLVTLFKAKEEIAWLSEDITYNRTPELRRYLMKELYVDEVEPETILPKLTKSFLEAQTDEWIVRLYEFLNGQPAFLRQRWLHDVPLVRLDDGSHVAFQVAGRLQAFLPGPVSTGFPTVRAAVCATEGSRKFLTDLGLTEPDPVDDVIRNLLPRYCGDQVDVDDKDDYEMDIHRILTAFATDSNAQREKLVVALRETSFVMAVDAGDGSKWVSKPGEVYLATERLKELFAGVADVLLVDDSYACLRGEDVRGLLEACGATRYLQPVSVEPDFTPKQLREMRRLAGLEECRWEKLINDYTLRGLNKLLDTLPKLDPAARAKKARLLWGAIEDVENRCRTGVFSGNYNWSYSHASSSATFDTTFVRQLNATAWVPDTKGELQRPEFVVFDTIGWKPNPFLQSKIRFKPPIIETLAREAGIEPAVLDLLKKYGLTSETELRKRLGIGEEPQQPEDKPHPEAIDDALKNLLGNVPKPTPAVPDTSGQEPSGSGSRGGGGSGTAGRTGAGSGGGTRAGAPSGAGTDGRTQHAGAGGGSRMPGSNGGRPFISYVGVHPEVDEPDPDGLDQQTRMALEEQAIQLILKSETQLQRTPPHNPGFDLFEAGADGKLVRWIEVKAMTGGLHDRPVGLSHTQFQCARENGEAYWLYVVEHAGDETARLVRIQDPAGKARTFTFDHGWIGVAEIDDPADRDPQEQSERK
jgi:hypothetical protein